jgi:hypothetical protein
MIPFPILRTPGGEELVVVPRAEYERLAALAAEAEEDADDVRAYDAAMAEIAADPDWFPADLTALLLKHKSRLTAIRYWRGLSLEALAEKVAVPPGDLAEFEAGKKQVEPQLLSRLAKALDVRVDWVN